MVVKIKKLFLLAILLVFSISFISSATNVSVCEVLDSENTVYTLNRSINSSFDCITINATNITFDCQGYNITYGNATGGFGVIVSGDGGDTGHDNITIQNCVIVQNESGGDHAAIRFGTGSENGVAYNNTLLIYGIDTVGIMLEDNSINANISLNNITTSKNESTAIILSPNGTGADVRNNVISTSGNDSSGILIGDNSTDGTIFNNTITTTGNLSLVDAMGGIFLEVNTSNINVSSNTITTSGLTATGIFVWGNSSLIDLNIITTSGNYSDGVYMDNSERMNLTNNNITTTGNYSQAIYAKMDSDYAIIYNNLINTTGINSEGIYLYSCSDSNISNNNLTEVGSYGIVLNTTNNSLVYSNTITNATDYGIYDYISSSSNISSNNISKTVSTTDAFGIISENSTSEYINSNILYDNDNRDSGAGTFCGGIEILYSNVTIYSNTIYGDTNESYEYPVGIFIYSDSGENSITLNNNIINSSVGNNSVGIFWLNENGLGTSNISGIGNIIRNSDTCVYAEYGAFVFSGATFSDCGDYDTAVSSKNYLAPFNYNTTLTLINVSLNISKLNVTAYSNISLQEYVRAYVNSTTANLSDATVTLVNNNSAEQQWQKTTTNGYTSYGGATYHFYNGTGYNYSLMTATATKSGYTSNSASLVIGEQSTINITLTATSSTDDDDDSTGGSTTTSSWTITHAIGDEQFKAGYTKELGIKNRLRVSIDNEYHYIGVVELTSTTAVINVSSTPQQATLSIGDTRRFDVNDDSYYDIKVTLNSISDNKASITILSISEEVTAETEAEEEGKEAAAKGEEGVEEEKKNTGLIILIIILILAAAVGSGMAVKKKRKQ